MLDRHWLRLPDPHRSAKSYLLALKHFLQTYDWLWTHHATDFFVNDYWNQSRFPDSWKFLKDELSYPDLLELATFQESQAHWPTDLREYIALSKTIPLPRSADDDSVVHKLKTTVRPLDKKIVYGMSPKKRHEVGIMAALIHELMAIDGATYAVDIGAGQGYLDMVLAFQYGHNVIGIDDDEIQTCGAQRRSSTIERVFADHNGGRLYHINRRVHATESLPDLVQHAIAADSDASLDASVDPDAKWLLCGLHSCGDLTPNIIRHFLKSEASLLAAVSCCYNHVTESFTPGHEQVPDWEAHRAQKRPLPKTDEPGFPMSRFLQSEKMSLGFTARMLACQATTRWAGQDDGRESYTKHYHRALLQYVIRDLGLISNSVASKDINVGRLSRSAFGRGFAAYAAAALSRLGISDVPIERLGQYEKDFEDREKEIAVVWTLRALLAPAIESMLLVDRFLHLIEESGQDDYVMPTEQQPPVTTDSPSARMGAPWFDSCGDHASSSVVTEGRSCGDTSSGAGERNAHDKVQDESNGIAATKGHQRLVVRLFPLFDSVESPRNMILVARKCKTD
ncbi:methyltransferase domain-containing protein [Polychytrium aggregatum]|uniref:methyltransferase domain-containing protein n=1 Tax=Polychytrium aggregatum TaxID=110093 RepID=UPI0022FEDA5F|nr:methyltransferase domain-containing protein [Polychytrium aggregatum]KAI9206999.1 methyltransferase domain-containing protein [Polychytrium aggregatum]